MFDIDPDIRKAKTIPSEYYIDPAFFQLSKERIFEKTWHFAGRADHTNTLRPFELLPGFLDEPLLMVKTGSGMRCLSNVCTHRGKILVEASCNANLIRCGYHGRRFSLEGKFLSMPEFDGVEDFPSEFDNLAEVAIAEMEGFSFVSLDPVDAFENLIKDSNAKPLHKGDLALTSSVTYEIDANWTLYCENYLEGFHIPFVHKSLNDVVDYGTYTTEIFRYSSVQTGYDQAGNVAGRYLFIFPNTMFNFYPWGISVNVVRPISPFRTEVDYFTYVADEALADAGAGADLHRVELEDEAVVESVQRGIRSRFYSYGRYSPTREQGTHHFHRLIAEFLNR